MFKNKILVDAIYLNSLGGLNLFKLFLESISNRSLYFIVVDKRFDLKLLKGYEYGVIKKNEFSRFLFYFKNKKCFSKVFCFSNIPPPLNINKTLIYFQNHLLINNQNSKTPPCEKLKLKLKLFYIRILNKREYKWIVQTFLIKTDIIKKLKVNESNVQVSPFFNKIHKSRSQNIKDNIFIYPAKFLPHKNHEILLESFICASLSNNSKIEIQLTIDKSKFHYLINRIPKIPSNLSITNLGELNQAELFLKYEKCKFLIFPSLKESFGLPLIEATLKGIKVITSDLQYVHEVIIPSQTFDPLSKESICSVIKQSLEINLPSPKLKIKNSINKLISNIENV